MNKKNLLVMKIKMFITSYFPLYIILLLLQLKDYPLCFEIASFNISATVFAIILGGFVIISILSTVDVFITTGNQVHKFDKIEKTGDAVISYMMTYIVPLLSEKFLSYNGFVINGTLFVLIGIMYIRLDLVYFNPTWIMCGYAVYTTESGNLILSNMSYVALKQKSGSPLSSSYLVKGLYLVQKKDNL